MFILGTLECTYVVVLLQTRYCSTFYPRLPYTFIRLGIGAYILFCFINYTHHWMMIISDPYNLLYRRVTSTCPHFFFFKWISSLFSYSLYIFSQMTIFKMLMYQNRNLNVSFFSKVLFYFVYIDINNYYNS